MQANLDKIYEHVLFLTSIYPYRNHENIESLNKAARYIEDEFRKTKLHVWNQYWEARGNKYENVIASYKPHLNRRFVVGAHYDVYKNTPGADDNASSVAGLLELARMVENVGELNYGIDFVAFSLEEPPFFKTKFMGSYIHAKSVFEAGIEVIGMISLEMIGYYENTEIPAADHRNFLYVSGIKKYDDFNKKISLLLRSVTPTIDSRRISYADDFKNNGPSDHRNYWAFNYPGVMVIGTGRAKNPHYHKISDTIETLNFETLTQAVNSIAYTVFNFDEN